MSQTISGVVYSPPRPGLPHVAVMFGPDGQTMECAAVPSVAEGEAFIAQVLATFTAEHGGKLQRF